MTTYHAGEIEIQRRAGVRRDSVRVGRIIASEIPPGVGPALAPHRLAVATTLDGRDRPWASLLTGPAGFITAVDEELLWLAVSPPSLDQTLVDNLAGHPDLGLVILDPRTRRRLRFNGRGHVAPEGLFVLVSQVYGNCPKYIQKRRLVAESADPPGATRRASALDGPQRAMLAAADTLFLATWHPDGGADASHRGGRPAFVRVLDAQTLEFPDYPGNNMFNSLGNIAGHPWAGLLVLDFATGDVLQLTGRARVTRDPERVVRLDIEEVRQTPAGTPLRWELVEPSPANP